MAFERLWYGRREHAAAGENRPDDGGPIEWLVLARLHASCLAGNFAAPHGALGYWVEYDPRNGRYWWLYRGQTFQPWPRDRGALRDDAKVRLAAVPR